MPAYRPDYQVVFFFFQSSWPYIAMQENRFVVKNIYAIKREQEFQDFAAKSAWMSNNRVLIHASRVPNYVGLLSRGLLLPKVTNNSAF